MKSISLGSGVFPSDNLVLFSETRKTCGGTPERQKLAPAVMDCSQNTCSYSSEYLLEAPMLLKVSSASTSSNITSDDSDIDSDCTGDELSVGSESEVNFTKPDVYGQKHPLETPELIQRKLHELDLEIAKIAPNNKKHLLEAERRCPKLLSDEFKLKFLRTDVFEADKAARRFAKYWKSRVETFGEDRAYREITADSLTETEKTQIRMNVFNVIERKSGRTYVFTDFSSIDLTAYDRDSMMRVLHYLLLSVIENDEASRKGGIVLSCPKNTKSKQVDTKLVKAMLANLQGILPIRLSGYHVVHPSFLFKSCMTIFGPLIPKRLRSRVLMHDGSDEEIFYNLKSLYGFNKGDIPTRLGGGHKCDGATWLDRRIAAGL